MQYAMIIQLHQGTLGFTRTDARIHLLLKFFVPNQTLDTNNNARNTTYDLFARIFSTKHPVAEILKPFSK
jgi:hypothetical protein